MTSSSVTNPCYYLLAEQGDGVERASAQHADHVTAERRELALTNRYNTLWENFVVSPQTQKPEFVTEW